MGLAFASDTSLFKQVSDAISQPRSIVRRNMFTPKYCPTQNIYQGVIVRRNISTQEYIRPNMLAQKIKKIPIPLQGRGVPRGTTLLPINTGQLISKMHSPLTRANRPISWQFSGWAWILVIPGRLQQVLPSLEVLTESI